MNNPLKYIDPSGYTYTPRWKQWWYFITGRYAYINSRDGQKSYMHNKDDNEGNSGGGGGGFSYSPLFSSPFSGSGYSYSSNVSGQARSGGGGGSGSGIGNASPGDPPKELDRTSQPNPLPPGPWSNETLDQANDWIIDYSNPGINLNPINPSVEDQSSANEGDGSGLLGVVFVGVSISEKAGEALNSINSKELQKLQNILETNNKVNAIKINNQLLKVARNGKFIKGIGFIGNVANLGAIGYDIMEQGGNITTENIIDGVFGIVAFVPNVGWMISSIYTLNKEASKTGYYLSGDILMW